MRIYNTIQEFTSVNNPILTIGTFDGVHLGHQKIINRLLEISRIINGEVVVLTFYPHPRMILYPDDHNLHLLHTLHERKQALREVGVQHLIIHPFDISFSRKSSVEFVREYLVNTIKIHTLVIGYDHHFGRNREGNIEDLKELSGLYGFHLEQISEEDINDIAISSTKIRKYIEEGNVSTAKDFLGNYYSITGKVVTGEKRGRTIGYPTANLQIADKTKLVPATGVYTVQVKINNQWKGGMLNIGYKPTFGLNDKSIEVHVFDFNADLYGAELTVRFIDRIREEKKFQDVTAIISALQEDEKNARLILSKITTV